MGNIHSVSFKKDEYTLYDFAKSHSNFSDYIKELIRKDKERVECIFNKEERKEIERIVKTILAANK